MSDFEDDKPVFFPFKYKEPTQKRGQTQLEHYFNKKQRLDNPIDLKLKEECDLDESQADALDMALQRKNMFITGRAGSGKSYLVRRIVNELEYLDLNVRVASTTGSSAIGLNMGATTLHCLLNFGDTGHREVEQYVAKLRKPKSKAHAKVLRELDVLIVDEISMCNNIFLDKCERIVREIRNREYEPWGGVQVIFCGDFAQLNYVPDRDTPNQRRAFHAYSWVNADIHRCDLISNHRQNEDFEFAGLLDRARFGMLSAQDHVLLRSRVIAVPNYLQNVIQLFSRNKEVDEYNEKVLETLDKDTERAFDREVKVQMKEDCAISEAKAIKEMDKRIRTLTKTVLRVNAKVILLHNLDVAAGLGNGTAGIVRSFDELGYPVVYFPKAKVERSILPHTWKFDREVGWNGSYKQIPLILGYAMSYHKAQGMTLENVVLSLRRRDMFCSNMGYVGISRPPSLNSLYLRAYEQGSIYTDKEVVEYYSQ